MALYNAKSTRASPMISRITLSFYQFDEMDKYVQLFHAAIAIYQLSCCMHVNVFFCAAVYDDVSSLYRKLSYENMIRSRSSFGYRFPIPLDERCSIGMMLLVGGWGHTLKNFPKVN